MRYIKSKELFNKSKKYMPGGVNSPVRAFKSVNMVPPFIVKGKGSRLYDADGNEYIDYVGSWGPMILGHAHNEVIRAIKNAIELGTSFGAPTERELILSNLICDAFSSVDKVRMVNSGTEGAMSALRVARAYTKRDKILKFQGCYHGHYDGLLVKAGSGLLTRGHPTSKGIPLDYIKNTLVGDYNDCDGLMEIFKQYGDELAAVIVEPVAANMGVVLPNKEFLELLRKLTSKHGTVLIFDEVITGFRLCYGGAENYYNIIPDLTVLGKIIGGGMPVGAYGGRKDIMDMVSPMGQVYQAGTLSGNPIAMEAGIKTLTILKEAPNVYNELDVKGKILEKSYFNASQKYNIDLSINRIGSLMGVFFNKEEVNNYNRVCKSNNHLFKIYFKEMIEQGAYIAPSPFEAIFVSLAHTIEDFNITAQIINNTFLELSKY
jgi:glutamate-1-semialdehyde 2,1-aminomutase